MRGNETLSPLAQEQLVVAAVHARLPGGSGGAAVVPCAAAATPYAERARPAVVVHDSLGQRHRHRDCLRKRATPLTWLVVVQSSMLLSLPRFCKKGGKGNVVQDWAKNVNIILQFPSRVRKVTGRFPRM